jgi:hypothetical protein
MEGPEVSVGNTCVRHWWPEWQLRWGNYLPKHQTTHAAADRRREHSIPHFSLRPGLLLSFSLRPALHTGPPHHPLRSSLTAICTSRHSPHHLPANRWNATADSTRHDPRVYQTSRAQPRCQTSYLQCSSLPPLVRIPHIPRSPSLFTPFPPLSRVRVA